MTSNGDNRRWLASNPDFDVTWEAALEDWRRMEQSRVKLDRPVVVLAGWRQGWPTTILDLSQPLGRLTNDDDILAIQYGRAGRFDPIADRVVREVEARWPSDDPERTIDVDVVGLSMGGLVGRRAAMGRPGRKRLNVKRLFTIATPHRGAKLAGYVFIDSASFDMRAGSRFLKALDQSLEESDYELHCYARLNDFMVGARNTAPRGSEPYWVSGSATLSHIKGRNDPRILADIARRLRGEEPLAQRGSVPPVD